MKKRGLGKGLDALLTDNAVDTGQSVLTVRLSEIEPNKNQPRKVFEPSALEELAQSIREHGVLQPLLVRELPGGGYQIIAGERRWRASRLAGLSEVPVIIRDLSENDVMVLALIENLQREDLGAIEEAEGYRELIDDVRRERALRLAQAGAHNVTAMSLHVGFADVTTFTRAFRRWTGTLPSRYRTEARARSQAPQAGALRREDDAHA